VYDGTRAIKGDGRVERRHGRVSKGVNQLNECDEAKVKDCIGELKGSWRSARAGNKVEESDELLTRQ
jgi:hypothetical protein